MIVHARGFISCSRGAGPSVHISGNAPRPREGDTSLTYKDNTLYNVVPNHGAQRGATYLTEGVKCACGAGEGGR